MIRRFLPKKAHYCSHSDYALTTSLTTNLIRLNPYKYNTYKYILLNVVSSQWKGQYKYVKEKKNMTSGEKINVPSYVRKCAFFTDYVTTNRNVAINKDLQKVAPDYTVTTWLQIWESGSPRTHRARESGENPGEKFCPRKSLKMPVFCVSKWCTFAKSHGKIHGRKRKTQ